MAKLPSETPAPVYIPNSKSEPQGLWPTHSVSQDSARSLFFTFAILTCKKCLVILICHLPVSFWTLCWFIVHLLRACSEPLPIFLWVICLFPIDLLKLFISPAFKHPNPLLTPPPPALGTACGQSRRRGAEPDRELGFSSECFNEASSGLPQIPVVGLLGTLPGPATTSGRQLLQTESPGKRKGGVGILQTPEIVCKI